MDPSLLARGIRWNLADLYASADDPRLRADLDGALQRARSFAERYRGTIRTGVEPAWIARAVSELESIYEQSDRPGIYAQLLHAADSRPSAHGALVAMTQERQSEVRNQLLFFELEWIALDDADAERVSSSAECARYRHYLTRMRRYRPHILSEHEEKILEETSNTGRRAFSRLFDELLSSLQFELEIEGRTEHLNESGVLALLHDPRREVRRSAAAALTARLREHSVVLTFIFNVTAQDHALIDRLRGFAHPMASRHLANEIDGATVDALMHAAEQNTGIVAEYYQVKRRLLGLDTLYDYDRHAPLRTDPERITWERARQLVLDAYESFSPQMRSVAALFFEHGWIDAEVRDGKRGGAFSAATVPSAHPYVLLSYLGLPRDVMTVAHELGHGVHQYLARERGHLQSDTALTMAETASIFGELLVFERMRESERDPRTRLTLLCEFIEEVFGTVFRQVALTRFELGLHEQRRRSGELGSEQLGEIWQSVNRAMYADSVTLTDEYRWWWAYIPHFVHSPFYCYAYSFGELLVLALCERYRREGAAFVPKYLDLLAAGGSAAPAELLARIGIDVREPTFWQGGIDVLRRMVSEVKTLAASV